MSLRYLNSSSNLMYFLIFPYSFRDRFFSKILKLYANFQPKQTPPLAYKDLSFDLRNYYSEKKNKKYVETNRIVAIIIFKIRIQN